MLALHIKAAVLVNTCAVTGEAEKQSRTAVRKIVRENPGVPVFITGCAATRDPETYSELGAVIKNTDKFNIGAYLSAINPGLPTVCQAPSLGSTLDSYLSKAFVQIQNGCNHNCAYCIVSKLRGKSISFEYEKILADVQTAIRNGFNEIVLTGVDIAGYMLGGKFLSDLCKDLLIDEPGIKRLRLSSLDPASPDIEKIIDFALAEPRMMPHLHLSAQSASATILAAMRRRHDPQRLRAIMKRSPNITFSWDLICGFPGETPELFAETVALIRELKPINIHAFPFSPRPGTDAATMPNQISRQESKERVKIVQEIVSKNLDEHLESLVGKVVQIGMERNNTGRTDHDVEIKVSGPEIPDRTVCNILVTGKGKGNSL